MGRILPVAKPWLDERDADAARRAILSGWVTQGPEVAAFEQEFAKYVGAPFACAVSNCTAALHLALLAVGVRPQDEVITVSHSFIATANAIRYCGAMPVFVDVQPGTYNLDPQRIEAAITPRTRAILCAHQMGMPCDMARILDIADRHSLRVVEDAACAVGSEIRWNDAWEKVGRPRADVACFSFHPRKLLTTGDGGMVTTADSEIDRELRLLRQHGMNVSDSIRHGSANVIFESYDTLGFNYRLTDIQAAVGREQLKRLPLAIERRRYLAARYAERLARVPGVSLPEEPRWAQSNWQSYCIRLPDECDQQVVMQAMLDAGVSTRRGVMCAHREAPYDSSVYRAQPLAQSEAAQDHCIVLPLFHAMSEDDVDRVVDCLGGVLADVRTPLRPADQTQH